MVKSRFDIEYQQSISESVDDLSMHSKMKVNRQIFSFRSTTTGNIDKNRSFLNERMIKLISLRLSCAWRNLIRWKSFRIIFIRSSSFRFERKQSKISSAIVLREFDRVLPRVIFFSLQLIVVYRLRETFVDRAFSQMNRLPIGRAFFLLFIDELSSVVFLRSSIDLFAIRLATNNAYFLSISTHLIV